MHGLVAEALQLGPCPTSLSTLAHIASVAAMAATDALLWSCSAKARRAEVAGESGHTPRQWSPARSTPPPWTQPWRPPDGRPGSPLWRAGAFGYHGSSTSDREAPLHEPRQRHLVEHRERGILRRGAGAPLGLTDRLAAAHTEAVSGAPGYTVPSAALRVATARLINGRPPRSACAPCDAQQAEQAVQLLVSRCRWPPAHPTCADPRSRRHRGGTAPGKGARSNRSGHRTPHRRSRTSPTRSRRT